MKFTHGSITNMAGEVKDIVVKTTMPVKPKDLAIGLLTIGTGIYILVRGSFKEGVKAFETAEYNTMVDLGIIKE